MLWMSFLSDDVFEIRALKTLASSDSFDETIDVKKLINDTTKTIAGNNIKRALGGEEIDSEEDEDEEEDEEDRNKISLIKYALEMFRSRFSPSRRLQPFFFDDDIVVVFTISFQFVFLNHIIHLVVSPGAI